MDLRAKNELRSLLSFYHPTLPSVKLLSYVFVFLLCLSVFIEAKESKDAVEALSLPERVLIRLECGELSDKDIKELEKLARKDDRKAIAVLAQFYGEFSENFPEAFKLLSPLLFEKKLSDEIIRVCSDKKVKIDDLLLKIPSESSWRKEESFACVALARLLALNGKTIQASQGFDLVGMNTQGIPQALASEGVGDMMFLLKRWEQSVGGYDFALKCLAWMKGQTEFSNEKESVSAMEGRIRRKLAKARKMLDSEQYGPEFVAYRDARRAEFQGDYLLAIVRYSQIRELYPDTVYSEAAGLYGPVCLLQLSDKAKEADVTAKIAELKKKVSLGKDKLKKAGGKLSGRIRSEWEELSSEDEKLFEALKKLPTGKKAENEGIAQIEAFILKNEFGLYRGEALLKLAGWTFEKDLDIDKALAQYQRAKKWFDEVARANVDVTSWTVPVKAASVSTPPPGDKMITGWNNYLVKTPLKPEQIINRDTAPWYLDSLRCECDKALGYIYFLKGDKNTALELAESVLKYDPMERNFHQEGEPNTYQRMLLCYKRGELYSPPEELAFFKDKLLIAVRIGEFYYLQEEWQKCLSLRQDILDEKYGKLNKEQKAIMIYRIADVKAWVVDDHKVRSSILAPFAKGEFKGTYIYPHALYGLATTEGEHLGDKEAMIKTIGYCDEALKHVKEQKDDISDKLKFFLAGRYYESLYKVFKDRDALKKAKVLYSEISSNEKSKWRNLSLKALKEMEEEVDSKK